MTITVKRALSSTTEYTDLGLSVDNPEATHDVSYTARGLEDFDGKVATAIFGVAIGGVPVSEPYRLRFTYSGKGNPLDEAEPALDAFLKRQAELAEQAAEGDETAPEVLSKS